jgi:hypothetical protein
VGCQIYDYRLRRDADTFIARSPAYPTGNSTLTHVFGADGTRYNRLNESRATRAKGR